MIFRLKPLFKLFYNPQQAMIEIAAGAHYVVGAALALAATLIYREALSAQMWSALQSVNNRPSSPNLFLPSRPLSGLIMKGIIDSASPLFFLVVVFVPACLLAASLITRRASFSVLLRQEYAQLATCTLYAWAAAHLMMLIPALFAYRPGGPDPRVIEAALRLVPLPYFVFLVTIALRAVLQTKYGAAIGVVALGACSLVALPLIPNLLYLLTSPFLLLIVILLLRNFFGDMMSAQRSREEFKQNLEAATLNPADASAHYNLGLIYQQRGQNEEAKASFQRAIEIDPGETDAHYQLGRIARHEGKLADAINHFDSVVRSHPDHSQSEIWREIGHAYFQAAQYEDARAAFERFLERRPSDAEGHYRYGLTLYQLGHKEEAESEMRACIEAARTSPAYKYRTEKYWMNEAQTFLRSQLAGGR